MMFRRMLLLCFLFVIVDGVPCFSHESMNTPDSLSNSKDQGLPQQKPEEEPGVTEKLGKLVAVDTVFSDENGRTVTIKDLLDKPTLVLPVYYTCPNVCNILQGNMTWILPEVELRPGDEYQVLSVSFDPTDTPKLARRKKEDYLNAMGDSFPPDGWHFLTGTEQNIEKFMDSIGFQFQQQLDMYLHPVVVVAVAPGGKIVRYLYGNDFLPFDVTLAMTEANQGKAGLSVKRVLSYCFSYDPEGKGYVLNVMRITGAATLSLLLVFIVALVLAGKKKRKRSSRQQDQEHSSDNRPNDQRSDRN